jgi:hypothetical protein
MTCWRRLWDWQAVRTWDALHYTLLVQLEQGIPGQRPHSSERGALTGPNPTDRRKSGSKRHILTERAGLPLVALPGAANRHDPLVCEQVLDAVPPMRQPNR